MAAASGNDDAANHRRAASTLLAVALIGAMLLLKFSAITIQIHVIGNGGAAQADRLAQNVLLESACEIRLL